MEDNLVLGLAVVVMVGVIPCVLGFADRQRKRGMKAGVELGRAQARAEGCHHCGRAFGVGSDGQESSSGVERA